MFLSLIVLIIVSAIIFKVYCRLTIGICKCDKHLVGKVVIVTGGNAGIGYETAKSMAERGARVILGCRNEGRGIKARDKIITATGNKDVHYRHLDFASLASVRAFAKDIIMSENRLDILINNAGILEAPNAKTEDGLSIIMQTNHFGPFLLTSLLLELLKSSAPSRIINVSSMAHTLGEIDFDNLNLDKETTTWAYGTTKLCNVLMTVELAERLKGYKVTANSLHPGAVSTEIFTGLQNIRNKLLSLGILFVAKDCWEGAQTTIYLAVSPEVEYVTGKFFSDCREQKIKEKAQDKEVARKLWEVSEELVGLK